jgi:hypothetical protein
VVRPVKESGLVGDMLDVVAQEHEWLACEGAEAEVPEWERRLEPGALSRILLSDRHLGHWTVEAVTAATPLKQVAHEPRLLNRYLAGLLRAVDSLVERQGVNAMFVYAVAGAPAMVMAELAKSRKLPLLTLRNTRIDNRQMVDTDNGTSGDNDSLVALYRRALKDGRVAADGIERARDYLETFRVAPVEPGHQSHQKDQLEAALSFRAIAAATRRLPFEIRRMVSAAEARNLRKPNPLADWCVRAGRPLRARIAQQYLETLEVEALEGRFAYYPLHVDPEASTMVLAPMFSDQGHVIEAIVKALPPDMTLLVKEHPSMHGVRPIAFYKRVRRLPRVRLISPTVSSFALIRRCDLTCSITGTAAWEAMLLRKPALVLGAFPFSALGKGLVTCRDFAHLPEAVGQALKLQPADDHSLLTFLAAIFSSCFSFPANLQWTEVTPQMLASNSAISEAMASQILQRLREAGIVQPMRQQIGEPTVCL